jgi:saccharopine dehydrogenase-like NADP-dependent oxidoreductase
MIYLFGAGRQGYVTLETLKDLGIYDVIAVERDEKNAAQAQALGYRVIGSSFDSPEISKVVKEGDLILNCLPARFGDKVLKFAASRKAHCIDISYMEEDPFDYEEDALRMGLKFIVDAGFAPGVSNFLIGYGYRKFGGVFDRITIKVGGIPAKPIPPFNYYLTWSPEDLLEEYRRPARIRIGGTIQVVPALSGVKEEVFAGIGGKFESFYTDGLRTLLRTISDVPNLEEKTVRYRGHAEIFRVLVEIGLLNKDCPIYEVFRDWLWDRLKQGSEEDLAILRIEFWRDGTVSGFELIHYYNMDRKRTAMSELTGIPPAILTKMFLDGKINQSGVLPLELLGLNDEFSHEFLGHLKKSGIQFSEF